MTGYKSKCAAAQDKLNDDDLTIAYQSGYYDGKKAAQEPVAMLFGSLPVYDTTPPQRTWVGLTDEEIDELHGSPMQFENSGELIWVRIIEAKLKEKNT